jgi:hypothetical protein
MCADVVAVSLSLCLRGVCQVGGEVEAKLPTSEKSALEVAKWKAGLGYGTPQFFVSGVAAKGTCTQASMANLGPRDM